MVRGRDGDIVDVGSQGIVSGDVELQVVALREVERRCRVAFLHGHDGGKLEVSIPRMSAVEAS
jgi:hypothetical protein